MLGMRVTVVCKLNIVEKHFFHFRGLRGHCLIVRHGQWVVQPSFCLEVDRWALCLSGVPLSSIILILCGPVFFLVLPKAL